jgi:hypothetical protein
MIPASFNCARAGRMVSRKVSGSPRGHRGAPRSSASTPFLLREIAAPHGPGFDVLARCRRPTGLAPLVLAACEPPPLRSDGVRVHRVEVVE